MTAPADLLPAAWRTLATGTLVAILDDVAARPLTAAFDIAAADLVELLVIDELARRDVAATEVLT